MDVEVTMEGDSVDVDITTVGLVVTTDSVIVVGWMLKVFVVATDVVMFTSYEVVNVDVVMFTAGEVVMVAVETFT